MSEMFSVRIQLFGAFRDCRGLGGPILELEVPRGLTVAELRGRIQSRLLELDPGFSAGSLVEKSAIGDETQILSESTVVVEARSLALLPPVCGG